MEVPLPSPTVAGTVNEPDGRRYIWVSRWQEFQHYPPRRDRGPAWIKDYTAQLDDERYLRLTDRQRALLRDLRDIFATMRGQLSDDLPMLARRRNAQTRRVDLEALNHAGFISLLSREALDQALEEFYASRAPARSQEKELETDVEKRESSYVSSNSNDEEARPLARPRDPPRTNYLTPPRRWQENPIAPLADVTHERLLEPGHITHPDDH